MCKQGPRRVTGGQFLVSPFPRVGNRDDVKNGKALHTLRVIERETVGNPTAAIVAGIEKLANPSLLMTEAISFAIARLEYGA